MSLFLKGVIVNNIYNKISEQQLSKTYNLQQTQQPALTQSRYKDMECIYESLKSQCNILCCWYCTLAIRDETPILAVSGSIELRIKAIFCSFTCGFEWAERLLDREKARKYKKMLEEHFICITGRFPKTIKRPLPCYKLQKFGGSYTIPEYINMIKHYEDELVVQYRNQSE